MKKTVLALSLAVCTLGAMAQTSPAKKTTATTKVSNPTAKAAISKNPTAKADSVKKAKQVKKVHHKKVKK